jgi:hypothetical protein
MVHRVSRRALLQASGLAASVCLAGCTAIPRASETQETSETFDAPETLAVQNGNGDVTVERGDSGDVEVDVTKTTRFGRDRFESVTLAASRDDDTLLLTVEREGSEETLPRVAVDLVVRVPDRTSLVAASTANGDVAVFDVSGDPDVSSANGDVFVRDVDGYPNLRSSNGDVELIGGRGLSTATTANGDIDVDITSFSGDVEVATTNGDIEIALSPSLDADIDARTGNGTVTVTGLELSNVRQSRTHLTGQLGAGGPDVRASSSNGDVDLDALDE